MWFILLVLFSARTVIDATDDCPHNSRYTTCVDPCRRKCGSRYSPIGCETQACSPGCQCKEGYFINEEDRCSKEKYCSVLENICPENAEYSSCACPKTCETYHLKSSCDCNRGCMCRDGFVKEKSGSCVPYATCLTEKCPPNAKFKECACNKTCESLVLGSTCSKESCKPGCECFNGYYFNKNGQCVPESICIYKPENCPINSVYSNCSCNVLCSTLSSGNCNQINCKPGCACKSGYYLHDNRTCVTKSECPTIKETCPKYAEWKQCHCNKTCASESCTNTNCRPGCECIPGYVLKGAECVPKTDCPKNIETCPKYAEWKQCSCNKSCTNESCNSSNCSPGCECITGFLLKGAECVPKNECPKNIGTCPKYAEWNQCPCNKTCGNESCNITNCTPGCECIPGYFSKGPECVPKSECPKNIETCPKYAEWKQCSCNKTCTNESCNSTNCTPGCECIPGYFLKGAECVPKTECPKNIECPKHSEWKQCPCFKTCANLFGNQTCDQQTCKPGCECLTGFYLNKVGDCVYKYECPRDEVICQKNAIYTPCSSCYRTCDNLLKKKPCNDVCVPKCDCKPGYAMVENDICIKQEDCPSGIGLTCPNNLEYRACNAAPLQTCGNLFDNFDAKQSCYSGCFCPENLVYDNFTNTCITAPLCTNSMDNYICREIDPFLEYRECQPTCFKTCLDPIPEDCDDGCIDGCFCKEGYYLNKYHKCVRLRDCYMYN